MTNPITEVTLPGAAARGLLERVELEDGVAAFSEQFLVGLEDARLEHTHLVTVQQNATSPAGIAAIAPDGSVELAVDPAFRRSGIGSGLAQAVLARRVDASLWAHGNLPAAQALASRLGLKAGRELRVMAIDGDALRASAALETDTIPAQYAALSYTDAIRKWGEDAVQDAWLAANNDAFSWHPEQGGWDRGRLNRAMEVSWFDPDGVRLLYHGETLAGFHWTKVHPDGTGEVYVVGLHSSYRGKGLGDPLLRIGLNYLLERGCSVVKLYVEADNGPAIHRYETLGFLTVERHVVYEKMVN